MDQGTADGEYSEAELYEDYLERQEESLKRSKHDCEFDSTGHCRICGYHR